MSSVDITARRAPRRRSFAAASAVAVLCALFAAMLAPAPLRAAAGVGKEASEYEVKAYFLSHFVQYTTWPKDAFASDAAPFVLLVVGEDPFGAELEKIFDGKKGAGRPIRIVRLKELDELPRAHLIFLARSHAKELGKLLAGPAGKATLIVGDSEGLAADGAQVNLYIDSKRTRFEVNTEAVKRARLSINPEMLKLARIVDDRKRSEDP